MLTITVDETQTLIPSVKQNRALLFGLLGFFGILSVALSIALGVVATKYSHAGEISPEMKRCNNNGLFMPDTLMCECFDCYSGENCEVISVDCPVDASVADARMFEEYFETYALSKDWSKLAFFLK